MDILLLIIAGVIVYELYTASPVSTGINSNIPLLSTDTSISTDLNNALASVTGGINKLVSDIQNVATANNINPAILYGIVSAEQGSTNPNDWNASAYNPNDPSGAYGLTQVLASTAGSLGVSSPTILLSSPTTALSTTAKYINTYSPNPNNVAITAGIYNGGPDIFNAIANGNVSGGVSQAINTYIAKAKNGYDYYNQKYGSNQ